MTNNSGRKKKSYNPLNKNGTFGTRRDFIEADYVNGVFDEHGVEKIRPMNKEEIEWLTQFYSETEHGNFKKNSEINMVQDFYNGICTKIRHAKKNGYSNEEVLKLKEIADNSYKELVQLRAETNTFYPEDEDRQEIYNKNYERVNDIFNVAKASGKLISYDLPEFDKFSSKAEKDINPEHLVLDYLTRSPAKKKMPRKKKRNL